MWVKIMTRSTLHLTVSKFVSVKDPIYSTDINKLSLLPQVQNNNRAGLSAGIPPNIFLISIFS